MEKKKKVEKKRKKAGYLMDHAPSFSSGSHMCARGR
jgi:hypothetical protein